MSPQWVKVIFIVRNEMDMIYRPHPVRIALRKWRPGPKSGPENESKRDILNQSDGKE